MRFSFNRRGGFSQEGLWESRDSSQNRVCGMKKQRWRKEGVMERFKVSDLNRTTRDWHTGLSP
jgi:hypothetical protein